MAAELNISPATLDRRIAEYRKKDNFNYIHEHPVIVLKRNQYCQRFLFCCKACKYTRQHNKMFFYFYSI